MTGYIIILTAVDRHSARHVVRESCFSMWGLDLGPTTYMSRARTLCWMHPPLPNNARPRSVSSRVWTTFWLVTAFFWGGTVVMALLFYRGEVDFPTSTIVSLYGTSIWLNACLLPFLCGGKKDKAQVWHEVIVLWLVCYSMTNALWEVPWLVSSPFIFRDLHSLNDVIAQSDWMRSNPIHMGYWVMASFSACDLRTVNHNSTFYTLELFAFLNLALAYLFYRLNAQRSPLRYLIPLATGGIPVAATFIFSFSEVFAGFANMPGGVGDTLLALLWTQYQYILFPIVSAALAFPLFLADLHEVWSAKGK